MNIIKEIKKLNLPQNEFVVVGSCILAMKGIRQENEIDDIDLLVSPKLFDDLKNQGWEQKPIEFDGKTCESLVRGFFEASREYWDDTTINFFEENSGKYETFEDIRFQSLQEFYERKKIWGREKDLRDVALIEDYFAKSL